MTTMTRSATPITARHRLATTAAMALLFWIIAASAVSSVHVALDPLSPYGAAIASIAAIVLCAYGYTRFHAREKGASHALGVGVAWLVLGIITEVAMTTRLGHTWYAVLGSPAHPLLRNVFLFVWIFAPALFARRENHA